MMPAALITFLNGLDGRVLPALDALVKVTLVLGLAASAACALGRASAATRHLLWSLALASAVAIPALSFALPRWQLPIVTLTAETVPVVAVEPAAHSAPALSRHVGTAQTGAQTSVDASTPAPPGAATSFATTRVSLTTALLAVWAIGVSAVLARLLLGLAAVQWMSRRTVRVTDAPWLPLARELAAELGITRVTFRSSARATMPMAAGVFRSAVLMPEDASDWPLERLRIVLLHELAHVKRRDCLTHVIAQVACALHWFNPLAWMAARHLRTERERACDDLVLACGTEGFDYAEELLEIARVMRGGGYPAVLAGATLAMAHRSQLEGRLMAILDPRVPRSGVSRRRAALAAALVACALPPLATMQPWAVATVEGAALAPEDTRPGLAIEPARTPSPRPEPRPQPRPEPQPTTSRSPQVGAREIAQSVASAVSASASEAISQHAAAIAEGAVQGAIHAGAQSTWQTVVQSVVQGAIQGANNATQTTDGKRAADPRTVAALTAALKDSDKDVRETVMHALVQLRDPSIFEPLVQALKDPSPDVREQAAHGLGQLRDKRAVAALTPMIKDADADVREQVVFALGQIRDARAVSPLISALKDENGDVREQAAFALGQLRDRAAVEALVVAIKDPAADVREQVAFALGQLRDPRAIDALTEALKDASADVRQQAAFALGQLIR